MSVESLCRAPPALVLTRRRRVPRREVPQQGPRTAVEAAGAQRAVEVLTVVEVPVHPPHLAVEHVARAVAAGVTVRHRVATTLAAQVQDVLQHDPAEVPLGPLTEPAQPLPEAPPVGGVVRPPDLPRGLRELVLQVLGAVPDLEPPVQEAQQDDHPPEQPLPGRLRRLPAVGADGLGGVVRGDVTGLLLEDRIGGLEVVGPGGSGRFRPQAAPTVVAMYTFCPSSG